MTKFYEEHSELTDDQIIREFFSRWLKSNRNEVDLISQVNQILSRKSQTTQSNPANTTAVTGSSGTVIVAGQ